MRPVRSCMRPRLLVLVAMFLVFAVAPLPGSPASASCAGPSLDVPEAEVVQVGSPLTVEGRSFSDGCRDSMSCSSFLGCSSCEWNDPPPVPMTDVELRLEQRGRSWVLGTADARTAEEGELGWITWQVTLPDDVRRGRAELVTDEGTTATIRLR